MAEYRLLLHKDYEDSIRELAPTTRRKAVWAQVLLGTRGRTPIVKGTTGRNARWRRTPVQGNHYYMWWIPQSESPLADATIGIDGSIHGDTHGNGRNGHSTVNTILVHSIRHHDETDEPIRTGSLTDYSALAVDTLDPRFDEQKAVGKQLFTDDLSIVSIKGLPGSGKTIALLYLLKDLLSLPGDGRIVYVTYTPRLKRAAQEFIESHYESGRRGALNRVRVLTLNEVMHEMTGLVSYAEPFAELDEFFTFLDQQNPADLGPWRKYPRTLFTEVRAFLLGQDFPAGYDWAENNRGGGGIDLAAYAQERGLDLEAAEIAQRLAQRVRHMRFFRDQAAARRGLQMLLDGQRPGWIGELDALVIDEAQDLTLLQIAFLAELMRQRAGHGSAQTLRFALAGDESQIVQPSGFDWGMTKYLVGEQLEVWPEEFNFEHQRRSPDNLAQLIDNSWTFYAHLPKVLRPSARSRRVDDGSAEVGGRIYLSPLPDADKRAKEIASLRELYLASEQELPAFLAAPEQTNPPRPDDEENALSCKILWSALLAELAARPGRALVDLTERLRASLTADEDPDIGHEVEMAATAGEVIFLPREIKGLERTTILIHGLNDLYNSALALCDDRGDGNIPRFEARRLFDEIRVALSRSTDNLVLLEQPDAPVLAALEVDRIDGVASIGWADLIESLQNEEMSELEAIEGYLREVEDLFEREKWTQAYARNRRSYAMAMRLGDRALQHEADVQYANGLLLHADSLAFHEDWAGAYQANRAAQEFSGRVRDRSLRRRMQEQRDTIAVRIGETATSLVETATTACSRRHFEQAYEAARAAYALAPMLEPGQTRQATADALADTCWSWAAHLVDRADVADVAARTADLLTEAADVLAVEENDAGAQVLHLLAARYRTVPQAHDLSEEQVRTLIDLADRYMTMVAPQKPDSRAYDFVRRWLYEAYGGLEDRVTLYYDWSAAAERLGSLTAQPDYRAQIIHLEQRLATLLERAGQFSHLWDDNDDLARFRALATGVHGDHDAASLAWESLGDPVQAAEQSRRAGDMERALQLLRAAAAPIPEDLTTTVKFLRLLEQVEQKDYGLRPGERRMLIERLDVLRAILAGAVDRADGDDSGTTPASESDRP